MILHVEIALRFSKFTHLYNHIENIGKIGYKSEHRKPNIKHRHSNIEINVEANKHRTHFLDWRTDLVGFDESLGNTFFAVSDKEFRIFILSRLWIGAFHFLPFSRTNSRVFQSSPTWNVCFGSDFTEDLSID